MKTIYGAIGLIILLFSTPVFSQDQIHKKNHEVIECKVKEVGMDEIKYSLPNYPEDVIFTIDKDVVDKVVFSNGEELSFKQEMSNPDNYLDNKKNAIKIDFLSPLTGNTTLYYERSLKPGRGLEAGLGIIGLGIDPSDRNASGAFVKFGFKFIKSPDFYLRGMKYAHVMKGAYVKPEITLGYYSRDFDEWIENGFGYYKTERRNVTNMAILVNFGKQWIFDNAFLVDFYGGLGYGFDSGDLEGDGYHYGFLLASEEVPISFSAGLKIGFLIK